MPSLSPPIPAHRPLGGPPTPMPPTPAQPAMPPQPAIAAPAIRMPIKRGGVYMPQYAPGPTPLQQQQRAARRQHNLTVEPQYAAEGRPTFIDADGYIRPKVDDETWQADQERKRQNATREAEYRRAGRPFFQNKATGEIEPEQPDDVWQAAQEKQAAVTREGERRTLIQKTIDSLAAEADVSRPPMTKEERGRAGKDLAKARREAISLQLLPALAQRAGEHEKSQKGSTWNPFDGDPAAGKQAEAVRARESALSQRLAAAGEDGDPVLDDQDWKDLEAAHPETVRKLRDEDDRLKAVDEATQRHTALVERQRDLNLRLKDPAKWEARREETLRGLNPNDLDSEIERMGTEHDAAVEDFNARTGALGDEAARLSAEVEQLDAENARRLAEGVPAGDLVVYQAADGSTQNWHRDTAARLERLLAQARQMESRQRAAAPAWLAERDELERDERLLKTAASLVNSRRAAGRTALRAQDPAAADFIEANEREAGARMADIEEMYPHDGPARQAAVKALQDDLVKKGAAFDEQRQAKARASEEKGAALYAKFKDTNPDFDFGTALKEGSPATANLLKRYAQETGVEEPEARAMLEDHAAMDWDVGDTKTDVRKLRDGRILVNPKHWLDADSYAKAVEASGATPGAKAEALDARAGLGEIAAANVLEVLGKNETLAPHVERFRSATALETFEKLRAAQKDDATINRIMQRFLGGTSNVAGGWMGAIAGITGWKWAHSAMEHFRERAAGWEAAAALTGGGTAAVFTSKVIGAVPSVLSSLGVGRLFGAVGKVAAASRVASPGTLGVGRLFGAVGKGKRFARQGLNPILGAALGAGAESGGGTYASAYETYRQQGLDPATARGKALVPAVMTGAMVSLLTRIGGPHGAEAGLALPWAKNAVKNVLLRKLESTLGGRMLVESGQEAWEEGFGELWEGFVESATFNRGKDVKTVFSEALEAALIGGTLGGAVRGWLEVAERAARKVDPGARIPAESDPVHLRPEVQAAAEAAISGYQDGAITKAAAMTVLKIARGEFPSLTTGELEAVGLTRVDGKVQPAQGKVSPVIEFADKEHTQPIIRQEFIDLLDAHLPEVHTAIGLDEVDAREMYAEISGQASEAALERGAAKNAEGAARPGMARAAPAGAEPAGSPEEQERITHLARYLEDRGLVPGDATRLAAATVQSRGVVGENYVEQVITPEFLEDMKAAGVTGSFRERTLRLKKPTTAAKSEPQGGQEVSYLAHTQEIAGSNPVPATPSSRAEQKPVASVRNAETGGTGPSKRELDAAWEQLRAKDRAATVSDLAGWLVREKGMSAKEAGLTAKGHFWGNGIRLPEASTIRAFWADVKEEKPDATLTDLANALRDRLHLGKKDALKAAEEVIGKSAGLKRAASVDPGPVRKVPSAPLEAAGDEAVRALPRGERKRARTTMKYMRRAMENKARVFDRIVTGVEAQEVLDGNAIMVNDVAGEMTLFVDVAEFIRQHAWLNRSADVATDTMVEEIIHAVALNLARTDTEFAPARLRQRWNSLPLSLRDEVWQAYNARITGKKTRAAMPSLSNRDQYLMMHEFLRMLVQNRAFRGRVSEAGIHQEGLLGWIKDLLAKLADRLESLLARANPTARVAVEQYRAKIIKAMADVGGAEQATKETPPEAKDSAAPAPAPETPRKPGNVADLDDKRASVVTDGAIPNAETQPLKGAVLGSRGTAYTDQNDAIEFQWAVVPVDALVISNDDAGRINPGYPQELQPRDRQSAGSESQVNDIAANMNLDRLSTSSGVGDGAPMISPDDFVVESGNGRTMGQRRAYERGMPSALTYRAALIERAGQFGLDPAEVSKVNHPVLVRVRLTPVNREAFVLSANVSNIAPKREIETAKADAKQMKPSLFEGFGVGEDGEIFTAANRDFVRAFVAEIVPPAERPAIMDAKGNLSQAGLRRIRNALFVAAYGDSPEALNALGSLTEAIDASGKNLSNALTAIAPRFAEQAARIEAGALHPLAITGDLVQAVQTLNDLRKRGEKVSDFLAQDYIPDLDEGRSKLGDAILRTLEALKSSPRKLIDTLQNYATAVENAGDPRQGSMFGDVTPTKEEVWGIVAAKRDSGFGMQDAPLAMAEKTDAAQNQNEPSGGLSEAEEWEQSKAAARSNRAEIIQKFEEDNQREVDREIADFGKPPTIEDIYSEEDKLQQWETATWESRTGKAAHYAISRHRERADESSPWEEWTAWGAYGPDDSAPAEKFSKVADAIDWLRTQPLEDAGEDVALQKTRLSEERRLLATYDVIRSIALPPGWVLDKAIDTQYGSLYWNVRGPLEPPNNEEDDRSFAYKLSARSHEPSPAREAQFGAVDHYVALAWEKGDAINFIPLSEVSEAMERLETWMWRRHEEWAKEKRQSTGPTSPSTAPALAAARKKEAIPPPTALKAYRKLKAIEQEKGTLDATQAQALERVEARLGQIFMPLGDERRDNFALEVQTTRETKPWRAEQMALFAAPKTGRELWPAADMEPETVQVEDTMAASEPEKQRYRAGFAAMYVPPGEALDRLEEFNRRVQSAGDYGTVINPDQIFHLTLGFGIEAGKQAAVAQAIAAAGPLTLTLQNVGRLPVKNSTDEYLMAEVAPSEALNELRRRILPFVSRPDREYRPHVTIAVTKAGEAEKYLADTSLNGLSFPIDSVVVNPATDGGNAAVAYLDAAADAREFERQADAEFYIEPAAGVSTAGAALAQIDRLAGTNGGGAPMTASLLVGPSVMEEPAALDALQSKLEAAGIRGLRVWQGHADAVKLAEFHRRGDELDKRAMASIAGMTGGRVMVLRLEGPGASLADVARTASTGTAFVFGGENKARAFTAAPAIVTTHPESQQVHQQMWAALNSVGDDVRAVGSGVSGVHIVGEEDDLDYMIVTDHVADTVRKLRGIGLPVVEERKQFTDSKTGLPYRKFELAWDKDGWFNPVKDKKRLANALGKSDVGVVERATWGRRMTAHAFLRFMPAALKDKVGAMKRVFKARKKALRGPFGSEKGADEAFKESEVYKAWKKSYADAKFRVLQDVERWWGAVAFKDFRDDATAGLLRNNVALPAQQLLRNLGTVRADQQRRRMAGQPAEWQMVEAGDPAVARPTHLKNSVTFWDLAGARDALGDEAGEERHLAEEMMESLGIAGGREMNRRKWREQLVIRLADDLARENPALETAHQLIQALPEGRGKVATVMRRLIPEWAALDVLHDARTATVGREESFMLADMMLEKLASRGIIERDERGNETAAESPPETRWRYAGIAGGLRQEDGGDRREGPPLLGETAPGRGANGWQDRFERVGPLAAAQKADDPAQNAAKAKQAETLLEQTTALKLEESAIQAYLDLPDVNVPASRQPSAKRAIAAAAAVPAAAYPVPDAGRANRAGDRLHQLRERIGRTWRGLTGQDIGVIQEAFKTSDTISNLIHDMINRDSPGFDIRGAVIKTPADFAAFNLAARTPFFESLKIAVLDTSLQVIHSQIVHVGGLNESIADPKTILNILNNARLANPKHKLAGWMIAHNHPSGDPSPSVQDHRITRKLVNISEIVGLPIMDHVITNGEKFFSFREHGLIGYAPSQGVDLTGQRATKPKLPILPTPPAPASGNLADWEVTTSGGPEIPRLDPPGKAQPYLATLRTADPDHYHVLYLDTSLGLRAVERLPVDMPVAKIAQRIVLGAAREGAVGYMLGMPSAQAIQADRITETALFPTDGQFRLARHLRDVAGVTGIQTIDLMIAGNGGYYSFKESGVMETPAEYDSFKESGVMETPAEYGGQSNNPAAGDQAGSGTVSGPDASITSTGTRSFAPVAGGNIQEEDGETRRQGEEATSGLAAAPKTSDDLNPLARLGWNHLDKSLSAKVADLTRWAREGVAETVAGWTRHENVAPFAAAYRTIKGELIPASKLPAEVLARKREMDIKIAMEQQRSLDLIRALAGKPKFSDMAYPKAFVENPAMRERLFDAMEGRADMKALPAEMQALGARLRAMLVKIGQEAVKQGRMSLDTFEGLRENYMPRFTRDEAEAKAGDLWKRFKLGVKDILQQRTTAWHIVDMSRKDHRTGDYVTVPWDDKGRRWRFRDQQHRDAFFESLIKREALNALQTDELLLRDLMAPLEASEKKKLRAEIKDLTLDQLDRPAEMPRHLAQITGRAITKMRGRFQKKAPIVPDDLVRDPVYAIARYAATMTHDNATAEFFNYVLRGPVGSDAGNAAGSMPPPTTNPWVSDTAASGFTEIPDTDRFGRLAGKHVRDDIAGQILELVHAPSAAMAMYDTMLAWWKTGKTVLNPGTHARNVLGNTFFSQLAGNSVHNPGNLPFYKQAVEALRNGGADYTELYENGVLGADYGTQELRGVLRGLVPGAAAVEEQPGVLMGIGKSIGRILPAMVKSPVRAVVDFAAKAYQVEDDVFKAAAYFKARAMLARSMGQEESSEAVKKAAAEHVRKWFPFFDQGSSGTLRALGRTALPFLGFYRESIRIFGNAVKERPIALAAGMAVPSLITMISAMLLGLDDDDLKEVKADMRGKGGKLGGLLGLGGVPIFSMLLPARTADGQLQQFDISAIHPFADFFGQRVEADQTKGWYQNLWRSMLAAGPLGSLAYSQMTGRDTFGDRPFVEANMTTGEKAAARADNAAKTLLPPLAPFGTGWKTLASAGERQTNKTFETRNPAQAVARAVGGVDVRGANPNLYRLADDWRVANGLPAGDGADFGTTPVSRARAALFHVLAQDKPNVEAAGRVLKFLKEQGKPIDSQKDINRLLALRNPLEVIRGHENQQRFRASLHGEARRVLDQAVAEYQRIVARAPGVVFGALGAAK